MPDEMKIVLKEVKENFGIVIEQINMTDGRMGRREEAKRGRFGRFETGILNMKKDIRGIRQDLSHHRSNAELHSGRKGGKVSPFGNTGSTPVGVPDQ